jgi:hypothetical protein
MTVLVVDLAADARFAAHAEAGLRRVASLAVNPAANPPSPRHDVTSAEGATCR